ncbi:hypothetical protein ACTJJ0_21460 [Chitinophaga sp. 22321]|uniref:Uncharacterized protein n=1 Tax=Chitinophaga hostae TaxID=2831022 RepID=A0ABS5J4B1_9BACT|nr:hypothetical protein [Chitinophaga hostae]MBS0030056.1 hypothetical protein [Chitinophaga hostae]
MRTMKTLVTLTAAAICLSFATPSEPPVKKQPSAAAAPAVSKRLSFPRDINWSISYMKDLPLVSLNWPSFSLPGLGPVQFTFMGVTQTVTPTAVNYVYWAGTSYTLTANTSYTMNIGGVSYYFYWPGNGYSQCVITGHN